MFDYAAVQDEMVVAYRRQRSSNAEICVEACFLFSEGWMVLLKLWEIPKELWRPAILQRIDELDPEAIVLHCEAYAASVTDAASAALVTCLSGARSLDAFPGRVETFMSYLEERSGKKRILSAVVRGDGTMGEPEEFFGESIGGGLANFFGGARGAISGEGASCDA